MLLIKLKYNIRNNLTSITINFFNKKIHYILLCMSTYIFSIRFIYSYFYNFYFYFLNLEPNENTYLFNLIPDILYIFWVIDILYLVYY